jgi:hypothetical protein
MGRPAYQREFRTSQAAWADSSYLKRAYTLPMRSGLQVSLGSRGMAQRKTYGRCCCHRLQPLQSRRTCTSHTRNPRKRRQSGSAVVGGSCCSWGRMRGFGRGWGGGWFASMRA